MMTRQHENRHAFRCSVAPENSVAKIKIAGKTYAATVLDTSSDGFCVRLSKRVAAKVKDHKLQVLIHADERWEVQPHSRYSACDQYVNIGFSRVRELTRIKIPSSWGLSLTAKSSSQPDPAFLIFLIVAFLIAAISLPGMGDHLGTAPKVRKALISVFGKME